MRNYGQLLMALFFLICGVGLLEGREIDGKVDPDNNWYHVFLPGYSTYDVMQDSRDGLFKELNNGTPGSTIPAGGIDIPTFWNGMKAGNFGFMGAMIWDAVKGGLWVYGISELDRSLSSGSSGKEEDASPGIPIGDEDCNIVVVDGSKNNIKSESHEKCSVVHITGTDNTVDTRGLQDEE